MLVYFAYNQDYNQNRWYNCENSAYLLYIPPHSCSTGFSWHHPCQAAGEPSPGANVGYGVGALGAVYPAVVVWFRRIQS